MLLSLLGKLPALARAGRLASKLPKAAGAAGKVKKTGGPLQAFAKRWTDTLATDPSVGYRHTDLLNRGALDIGMGTFYGFQNPGDIFDKGASATVYSLSDLAGGNLLSMMLPKKLRNSGWRQATEAAGMLGGNVVGDMALQKGLAVKDKLVGGLGEDPYTRMYRTQNERDRAEMEQNILASLGLGGYNMTEFDPRLMLQDHTSPSSNAYYG